MTFSSSFSQKVHCIHILWCIFMGLGHNDPWVESHMWPQQMWGQRSSRGQWPLVQVFLQKRSLYLHTLMYFHGTWTQWSLGRVTHKTSTDVGSKVIEGPMTFGSSFCKNCHCIHILSCMFRRDSWFQNHMFIYKPDERYSSKYGAWLRLTNISIF